MNFTVMTAHRFGSTGEPLPDEARVMVPLVSVTNGEIAEKIVDRLKRQRFTDENGRTRYRYGRRGVKLVSQD
jgi:hypothetical protein